MSLKKKLLSCSLAVALTFGSVGMIADAANVVEVPSTEIDGVLYQEVDSNTLENWPAGPQIYSESGIVMDMDSGAILYAKNI
ncbi:MAG: D-alanyl-D-alanine carboxypeptidase, partial [Faecalimonas sp.]|nr:D-alanyl-D-alanine carboxypeptidase [Faecalimonas sp.]